jgi:hypothetical protein
MRRSPLRLQRIRMRRLFSAGAADDLHGAGRTRSCRLLTHSRTVPTIAIFSTLPDTHLTRRRNIIMPLPREKVLFLDGSQWADLESTLVSAGLNVAELDVLYAFDQPPERYAGVTHTPTGYTLILHNVVDGGLRGRRPGLYVTAEPGPPGPDDYAGPMSWKQVLAVAREWGMRVAEAGRAMGGRPSPLAELEFHRGMQELGESVRRVTQSARAMGNSVGTNSSVHVHVNSAHSGWTPADSRQAGRWRAMQWRDEQWGDEQWRDGHRRDEGWRDEVEHFTRRFKGGVFWPVTASILLVGVLGDFVSGVGVLQAIWTFLRSLF